TQTLEPCLTKEKLIKYGIAIQELHGLQFDNEQCFKSMTQTLEPCLTKEKLIKYGIAIQELHGLQFDNEQ
ncbi:hypothetical protein QTL91_24625, partial [Salmonella enterica subsp. enterica serovar Typhimurium]|uniref:hypothetical protein n=1 Tax=Salmonella enterica TaxID=28901 RepID=UPI00262526E3